MSDLLLDPPLFFSPHETRQTPPFTIHNAQRTRVCVCWRTDTSQGIAPSRTVCPSPIDHSAPPLLSENAHLAQPIPLAFCQESKRIDVCCVASARVSQTLAENWCVCCTSVTGEGFVDLRFVALSCLYFLRCGGAMRCDDAIFQRSNEDFTGKMQEARLRWRTLRRVCYDGRTRVRTTVCLAPTPL